MHGEKASTCMMHEESTLTHLIRQPVRVWRNPHRRDVRVPPPRVPCRIGRHAICAGGFHLFNGQQGLALVQEQFLGPIPFPQHPFLAPDLLLRLVDGRLVDAPTLAPPHMDTSTLKRHIWVLVLKLRYILGTVVFFSRVGVIDIVLEFILVVTLPIGRLLVAVAS